MFVAPLIMVILLCLTPALDCGDFCESVNMGLPLNGLFVYGNVSVDVAMPLAFLYQSPDMGSLVTVPNVQLGLSF